MSPTLIQVKVKPGAHVSSLERASGGVWVAQLKSPPVDGKANEELVALIARQFQCRKSAVSIKSGASGRTKLIRIDGACRAVASTSPACTDAMIKMRETTAPAVHPSAIRLR
jgi:uncharacterized protein